MTDISTWQVVKKIAEGSWLHFTSGMVTLCPIPDVDKTRGKAQNLRQLESGDFPISPIEKILRG